MSDDNTLDNFLKLIVENLGGKDRVNKLAAIHRCIDRDLAKKLDEVVREHFKDRKSTIGGVLGTFAYILGTDLAANCPSHDKICEQAENFGDYIHNIAHAAFDKTNPTSKQKH